MYYIVNAKGEVVGTASGPVNSEDLAQYGSIAVQSDLNLLPSEVKFSGSREKPAIVAQPSTVQPVLVLSSTAVDTDGDGVPELKADGKSTATLTVNAKAASGDKVQTPAVVTFRTTAGRLGARTAELKDGAASVQFTAGYETISVRITASAVGFDSGSLFLEFVP